MEHTENYQLSLWEQDDRIMREDFNDNNAKIDTALHRCSYVTGTYEGTCTAEDNEDRLIPLGFHPSFVIIAYMDFPTIYSQDVQSIFYIIARNSEGTNSMRLTENGFLITKKFYDMNKVGSTYCYIAFR